MDRVLSLESSFSPRTSLARRLRFRLRERVLDHPLILEKEYGMEATVSGLLREDTGVVFDIREFDRILRQTLSPLEEVILNEAIPSLQNQAVTLEGLIQYLVPLLRSQLEVDGRVFESLRLWTEPDFWVEYQRAEQE